MKEETQSTDLDKETQTYPAGSHQLTVKPATKKPRPKVTVKQRLFGTSNRVLAFDVARCLALIGMFTVHMYHAPDSTTFTWESLSGIAGGRSAALFAFLAGISLGIISGGTRRLDGKELLRARLRVASRAALLLAIVAVADMINNGVLLILGFYSFWFFAALPFLRCRPRVLFAWAGGLLLFGGLIIPGITSLAGTNLLLNYLFFGLYNGFMFMVYILCGIALCRLGLAYSRRIASITLVIGLAFATVAIGGSTLVASINEGRFTMPALGYFSFDEHINMTEEDAPDPHEHPAKPGNSTPGTTPDSSGHAGEKNFGSDDAGKASSTQAKDKMLHPMTGKAIVGDRTHQHYETAFPLQAGAISGHKIPPACTCDYVDYGAPSSKPEDSEANPGTSPDIDSELDDAGFWQSLRNVYSWDRLLDVSAHSNCIPEVVGNLGVAMFVTAGLVLLGRRFNKCLFWLAAMGSMSLTVYVTHVLWISAVSPLVDGQDTGSSLSYLIMVPTLLVACVVYKLFCSRGPLEELMHRFSHRAGHI